MHEAEITDPTVVGLLLVAGKHPKGGILPAGPLDPARGGDANAVGVQEQHHHHSRLIGLDPAGISGLVDRIDGREVQLRGQIQQKEHQMVRRQPLHWRGRQQQRLLRVPWAEGFGLAHAPFSRPDPLLSLGSGQIGGRLWRSGRRGYVRQAPRSTGASTAVLGSPAGTLRCRPSAGPPLGSLRTCDSRSSSPRLRTTSVDRGLFRDEVAEQIDPRKTAQPQSPDR